MNKEQLESRAYMKPEYEVMSVMPECFICTSVSPDAPASTEDDWEYGGIEEDDGVWEI